MFFPYWETRRVGEFEGGDIKRIGRYHGGLGVSAVAFYVMFSYDM
jgi:hypothetical protein